MKLTLHTVSSQLYNTTLVNTAISINLQQAKGVPWASG